MQWISQYRLDIIVTILGLLYIWLEYRAHILLWVVGIVMPALDIILYWQHGLYGDSLLAVYYLLAAVYGLIVWLRGSTSATGSQIDSPSVPKTSPITHMPRRKYLPAFLFFLAAWAATWFILVRYTNSTVPILDGFTNALSFVALWALARKYVQQWLFWIVVDGVCCYLYIVKGMPFKAGLYGIYVAIAVAGYFKWNKMIEK